jgi:hypothetical protein
MMLLRLSKEQRGDVLTELCADRFMTDRPVAGNVLVGVVRVQAVNYPKKYSIRFPQIP